MDERRRPADTRFPRRRPDQLVLYWQLADGTRRTVAHGQRAVALFHQDPDVIELVAGMTLILGVMLDDGMIDPLIRRGPPVASGPVLEPDERPYDGPDGSCDRPVPR